MVRFRLLLGAGLACLLAPVGSWFAPLLAEPHGSAISSLLGTRLAYADEDDGEGDEAGDEAGEVESDGEGEVTEGEETEGEEDQPPVTAGGLFTLQTYPIRELYRPMTMTRGITQVRAGIGVDVSAQQAFEAWGHVLEARYGARDNVTVLGAFNSAYNFASWNIAAGVEASLVYDLVDVRTSVRLGKAKTTVIDAMGKATETSKTAAHVDVGFPFRYVAKPEIAIIALDTLMTIDFDGKPDLNPSVGVATNPIEPISVVVYAQMQIVDFNTDADKILVPATARLQFSPTQTLDVGAEFTFLNVKPPTGNFYDQRFLSLYGQLRF